MRKMSYGALPEAGWGAFEFSFEPNSFCTGRSFMRHEFLMASDVSRSMMPAWLECHTPHEERRDPWLCDSSDQQKSLIPRSEHLDPGVLVGRFVCCTGPRTDPLCPIGRPGAYWAPFILTGDLAVGLDRDCKDRWHRMRFSKDQLQRPSEPHLTQKHRPTTLPKSTL